MAQTRRSTIAVAVSVALLLGLEANPIVGAGKPAPVWRAPAADAGPGRGGPDYRAKTTTQLTAQIGYPLTPTSRSAGDAVRWRATRSASDKLT